MACEKCWNDAFAEARRTGQHQAEVYRRLLAERASNPCTPDGQPRSATG